MKSCRMDSAIPEPHSNRSMCDAGEVCYICLCGSEPGNTLDFPCACPRPVHLRCLARWNLQSAGRAEEMHCRFCQQNLPDWRAALAPPNVKPARPVMAIKFEGQTYKLKVKPGADGLKDFKEQVRLLLGFDITDEFDVCFEASLQGEMIKLSGLSSYGAATDCASFTAGERQCMDRLSPGEKESGPLEPAAAPSATASQDASPRGGEGAAARQLSQPMLSRTQMQPLASGRQLLETAPAAAAQQQRLPLQRQQLRLESLTLPATPSLAAFASDARHSGRVLAHSSSSFSSQRTAGHADREGPLPYLFRSLGGGGSNLRAASAAQAVPSVASNPSSLLIQQQQAACEGARAMAQQCQGSPRPTSMAAPSDGKLSLAKSVHQAARRTLARVLNKLR